MRHHEFPSTLIGFYWAMMKKFRWQAIALYAIGIFTMAWSIAVYPFVIQKFYSIFDYSGPDIWSYARHVMMLAFAAYILMRPIWVILDSFEYKCKPRMAMKIRSIMLDRIYSADYKFFLDKNIGEIQSEAGNITGNFYPLAINLLAELIGAVIGIYLVFHMLKSINPIVAGAILGGGIMMLGWSILTLKIRAKLQSADAKAHSKLSGTISDSIMNFMNIKIFASKNQEMRHIGADMNDALRKSWKDDRFGIMNGFFKHTVQNTLWLGIIGFCIYLFSKGEMNAAGFALALTAHGRFESKFNEIGRSIVWAAKDWATAKQAWNAIIAPPNVVDKAGAKPIDLASGKVELRGISFKYHKDWIVRDLSMNIKPGEHIGIVGLSGAGKTTLSHLLLRLFDVQKGGIYIDEQNIKSVRQESLREQIAFVPQDPVLFNRTIGQNIGYSKPDAAADEIESAAKLANIHDFIMSTEHKYDTIVGNRGIKLSGGQRQRIAIARAILKNSKILILDEATSSLDSDTEGKIQKSLDVLMRGRTAIAIAHRLSTLRKMDRIVVMENGKIAEEGAHAELIKKPGGIYARLWKMQSDGFIQG